MVKHKNTYKFAGFAERISKINVKTLARSNIAGSNIPDAEETFFFESLNRWVEMDASEHFEQFKSDLPPPVELKSYAQLLHHQKRVVNALTTHLNVPESLSLPTLLDLVVAVSRDLQSDFYPYFWGFFTIIWKLIETEQEEPELLEQAFGTVAHLLKFTRKKLLGDLETGFRKFLPLFFHKRAYVRRFTSEAFAYLIRKHESPPSFFGFTLNHGKKRIESGDNQEQIVQGLAELWFQTVRGISHRFHSCAPQWLLDIFQQCLDKSSDETWAAVLKSLNEKLSWHARDESEAQMLNIILDSIMESKDRNKDTTVRLSLSVLEQWVTRKKAVPCLRMESPVSLRVHGYFISLINELDGTDDSVAKEILRVALQFLTSGHPDLDPQGTKLLGIVEAASELDSKFPLGALLVFIDGAIDLPHFDSSVLPSLMDLFERHIAMGHQQKSKLLLDTVTQIAMIRTGWADESVDMNEFSRNFNFPVKTTVIQERCIDVLETFLRQQKLLKDSTSVMNSEIDVSPCTVQPYLTILPLVLSRDHGHSRNPGELCVEVYQVAIDALKRLENIEFWSKMAVIAWRNLVKLRRSTPYLLDIPNLIPLLLKLISKKTDSLPVLLLASFLIQGAKLESNAQLGETVAHLSDNLRHWDKRVRLLSLRILCSFPTGPIGNSDSNDANKSTNEQDSIFQICLQAETTPLGLESYRARLRFLRMLNFNSALAFHIPTIKDESSRTPYFRAALNYLISQFYGNFTLVWDPVTEIIESYAREMKGDFWLLWSEILKNAKLASDQELFGQETDPPPSNGAKKLQNDTACEEKSRIDHSNFRIQLWRTMSRFADISETKTRFLSPELLEIANEQMKRFGSHRNKTDDLTNSNSVNQIVVTEASQQTPMETEQTDSLSDPEKSAKREEEDTELPETDDLTRGEVSHAKQQTRKLLLTALELFSKFKSWKNLAMEPKLKNLYYELLQATDPALQQKALECIISSYHYDFLVPYKDNLFRLLEEKPFRDELVLFNIDPEVSVVESDHRRQLLPFLLRILYGRMHARCAKKTAIPRKNAILQFLAGCQSEEIIFFLKLLFKELEPWLRLEIGTESATKTVGDTLKDVSKTYPLEASIPLKRLRGMMTTLSAVMKRLAPVLEPYLPLLFRICLVSGAITLKVEDQKNSLAPQYVNAVKTLRNETLDCMREFMTHFQVYDYTKEEISGLFSSLVWPQIEKLPTEGIYSPSGLLRLFTVWSENPRYFPLLNLPMPDSDLVPIKAVVGILANQRTAVPVQEACVIIVENLLFTEDYDPIQEKASPVPESLPQNVLPITKEGDTTLGVKIAVQYLPGILNYFSRLLGSIKGRRGVTEKNLSILSRLGEFTTEHKTARSIVSILISFFESVRKGRPLPESAQVQALKAATSLVSSVDNSEEFIKRLSVLFSKVCSRGARDALMDLLKCIGTKTESEDHKTCIEYIVNLNSWDRKRLEEPDYLRRLDSYKEINKIIASGKPQSQDFILCIINNCVYFISHVEDLSLRDNAGNTLRELIKSLAKTVDNEFLNTLLSKHLIPLLKKGLRSETEAVRNEFVQVLAILVRSFPQNPKFQGLIRLTNDEETDLDFFENIRHIQLHRRVRAIRRLCGIIHGRDNATSANEDSLTDFTPHSKLSPDHLSSYILPLVTPFLFDRSYRKNSALAEASFEFIGALASVAEWKRYFPLLRYYLGRLLKEADLQKVLVKITVAILDGFHFSLDEASDEALMEDEGEKVEEMDVDPDEGEKEGKEGETKSGIKQQGQLFIQDAITSQILPKLHKCLNRKKTSEGHHKLGGRGAAARTFDEDEDILRVPIALAAVKLLLHLSTKLLEAELPAILLKVCQLLKSRSKEIREETRKILAAIVKNLGPRYLPFVIRELKVVLARGYQVHVCIFTTHVLISSIEERLKSGDLDPCAKDVSDMCQDDLFGATAEEKEAEEVTKHLMEAKSNKTKSTYYILGKYLSANRLNTMFNPLKEALCTKQDHKTTAKIGDVLKNFAFGLSENKGLSGTVILTYAHQALTEHMPALFVTKKKASEGDPEPSGKKSFRPESILIIPKNPGRIGEAPKTSRKSNLHVLVEFGLQLLSSVIRKGKVLDPDDPIKSEAESSQAGFSVDGNFPGPQELNDAATQSQGTESQIDEPNSEVPPAIDPELIEKLDPFISILLEGLKAKYDRVISLSLRTLNQCVHYPLPSLRTNVSSLVNQLFVLLRQYAGLGDAAKGETFELIVMLFKTLTTIIREMDDYEMNTKQIEILLHYAEQDVLDVQKQATAFSLLKAIIGRQLISDEIPTVVWKIQELAITSLAEHVRAQSRQVVLQYLLHHPAGKEPRRQLEFFLAQLEYEFEDGRISALEMLDSMFEKLPKVKIEKYSGFCLVRLAVRLGTDQLAKCRKMLPLVIKRLLSVISNQRRDEIFDFVSDWIKSEKDTQLKLAGQLIWLFCEVEGTKFLKRFETILPIFLSKLRIERYNLELDVNTRSGAMRKTIGQQHVLATLLQTFRVILELDGTSALSMIDGDEMSTFWDSILSHLRFPRLDVRQAASSLCGQLFSTTSHLNFETCVPSLKLSGENETSVVDSLCQAHIVQLKARDFINSELADQAVKNLVFLARVLNSRKVTTYGSDQDPVVQLAERFGSLCRFEVTKDVKQTFKRSAAFKWLAAVSMVFPEAVIARILKTLMPHLYREMTVATGKGSELGSLATEVSELMKAKVGLEPYTRELAECQKEANQRKTERRTKIAQEAVTDPEKAAKRRMKKQKLKQESRKRKIYTEKPYKAKKSKPSA